MPPSDPEEIARRLYAIALNSAIKTHEELAPGALDSDTLIRALRRSTMALEKALKSKQFDQHFAAADAAIIGAIAYAIARNEGLLTRVDWPSVVERMQ